MIILYDMIRRRVGGRSVVGRWSVIGYISMRYTYKYNVHVRVEPIFRPIIVTISVSPRLV